MVLDNFTKRTDHLTQPSSMKIKEQFKIKRIGDEEVLVSAESGGLDFSRVMVLNATAAYLLRETADRTFDAAMWVDMLTGHYPVDSERAEADVERLLEKLKQEKVLE